LGKCDTGPAGDSDHPLAVAAAGRGVPLGVCFKWHLTNCKLSPLPGGTIKDFMLRDIHFSHQIHLKLWTLNTAEKPRQVRTFVILQVAA